MFSNQIKSPGILCKGFHFHKSNVKKELMNFKWYLFVSQGNNSFIKTTTEILTTQSHFILSWWVSISQIWLSTASDIYLPGGESFSRWQELMEFQQLIFIHHLLQMLPHLLQLFWVVSPIKVKRLPMWSLTSRCPRHFFCVKILNT